MNFEQLDAIACKYGTPYYIMDENKYTENIRKFQDAFIQRYDKLIVGYSFKTNYVPALCMVAKEIGCYAEVVSSMEFEIAQNWDLKT